MSHRPHTKASPQSKVAPPGARPTPGRPSGERSRRSTWWIAGGAIVVVAVLLIVALASGGSDTDTPTATPGDAASVLAAVVGTTDAVSEAVGVGTASNPPQATSGPALTKDGKPRIAYVGAEYCPYCAAERWAMVLALSRFGTFSKISLTRSAHEDVFPDTATFSFHGVGYTSDLISFTGTEVQGRDLVGGAYEQLDTPDADIERLMTPQTGFPFVAFAGTAVLSGATYDPGVLQGKSPSAIAAALRDPADPITKGIVGSANVITAAICATTSQQPATVCNKPAVRAAARS